VLLRKCGFIDCIRRRRLGGKLLRREGEREEGWLDIVVIVRNIEGVLMRGMNNIESAIDMARETEVLLIGTSDAGRQERDYATVRV
jgi:hypothetical protein